MSIAIDVIGGGYVMLDQIVRTANSERGRIAKCRDGSEVPIGLSFDLTFIQLIPAEGWEKLTVVTKEGEPVGVEVEPMIAWGLTVIGIVLPVAPSDLSFKLHGDQFVIRRIGSPRVYIFDDWYDDEAAWWRDVLAYWERPQPPVIPGGA